MPLSYARANRQGGSATQRTSSLTHRSATGAGWLTERSGTDGIAARYENRERKIARRESS
jgi:hypothetical protein